MGLDMYAYRIEKSREQGLFSVDFSGVSAEEKDGKVFHYWRKHWTLDRLMHILFKKKGGKGTFNCQFLQLTELDLNYLESIIYSGKLKMEYAPDITYDKYIAQDDLDFIAEARKIIDSGDCVYYYNWW